MRWDGDKLRPGAAALALASTSGSNSAPICIVVGTKKVLFYLRGKEKEEGLGSQQIIKWAVKG
jgi:hypothetical protein